MILVQNHQQLLSGNKNQKVKLGFIAVLFLLVIASCAPRKGVLRSPDPRASGTEKTPEVQVEVTDDKDKESVKKNYKNQIALLLPFQLNKIEGDVLSEEDIKRSSLALDFYQGFQLGLDELTKSGANFSLNILDSRDNAAHIAKLSKSEEVKNASIVIGPIYPSEIKSFGSNFANKNILQVSPLAASMATEFNLPNLVSLTPSIRSHMKGIANQIAKLAQVGDQVIIFNTTDNDNKQFVSGLESEIKKNNARINVTTVNAIAELNDKITLTGKNIIVTGTTNKFQITSLINYMDSKSSENGYVFKIFGHPLWAKYDFSDNQSFANYQPIISSESILKKKSSEVRSFEETYKTAFGINPSDHSYKGYDAARYFGQLIEKYGNDYPNYVVADTFTGIYSTYKFSKNSTYGYVNESISFLEYKNGAFQVK